ncbi:uncharacterized protein LOC143731262 [Siphateles boraxobius]|uniref:uncharacterized protein LOC143731262 n=1 Tax=Siphateles boraxobius TaxID=180520 RepID=UPI004064111D
MDHPAVYQRIRRWSCNGVRDIFMAHLIDHHLNTTVYLSRVADPVHPFMTTVCSSSDGYFQQDNTRCSSKTGIFVLLGTVCVIISLIMTSVIFFHQQRRFSELESWINIHSSNQTSVSTDLQITESLSSSLSVLKSSVSDLTSSVASLSSKQQISEERVNNALKDLKSNMRNKTADVPVTCKSGWISYKSSCFLFSNNKLSWTEARDYCKAQGTLLLKIEEDDEEWAFLKKHTISEHYWVGLTDQNTGQWRWADDTPYTMNKERWSIGQPDDWKEHGLGEKGEEGEDCGQIIYTGELNDGHCSSKMRFICRV